METESADLLRELLPKEWIVRSLPQDYGVDFEVELVDQEVVSGNRIWLQLKAVQNPQYRTQRFRLENEVDDITPNRGGQVLGEYLPFSLETREISYALRCGFPLLLFVADLTKSDIYWLPIRNEVTVNLARTTPDWPEQGSATMRIPIWNSLRSEALRDFDGLRWYALEPARMYAFATLHYLHHEFTYQAELSGYSIGDGEIDEGDEVLRGSLLLAKEYIEEALGHVVLFGSDGVDFFRFTAIPGFGSKGIALQLRAGAESAKEALARLDSRDYAFESLAPLLGSVQHAINLFSTAIASYHGFRQRHLLTPATATYHAGRDRQGQAGTPAIPLRTESE